MKLVFLLLISLLPAYSQLVSFGVKAGVPLTDAYNDFGSLPGKVTVSQSNDRYTVGPTAEIHFLFHLSLEADALYRHSGFGVTGQGFPGSIPNGLFSVNDWQVPVLGKYQLPVGVPMLHPFVDAGPVYRHVSNNAYGPTNPNSAGFAIGGGVTLRLLMLRLSPEIRFTHWGQTAFNTLVNDSTNNQADFLVGFTF